MNWIKREPSPFYQKISILFFVSFYMFDFLQTPRSIQLHTRNPFSIFSLEGKFAGIHKDYGGTFKERLVS